MKPHLLKVLYCSPEDSFFKKLVKHADGFELESFDVNYSGSPQKVAKARKASVILLKFKSTLDEKQQQWLARGNGSVPVILLCQNGTLQTAVNAMQHPIADYFCTSQNPALICQRILEYLTDNGPQGAKKPMQRGDVLLHGRHPEICRINEKARSLAESQHPVLLMGEPGTGKEHLANGIYRMSPAQNQPFVRYDCRLIQQVSRYDGVPPSKFIITGLQELKKRHRGGVLFLQHMEQLQQDQQNDVMEASQKSQFRLIASLQSTGTETPDVISTLRLPALRNHPEDIPAITELMIHKIAQTRKCKPKSITGRTVALMQEYHWPGNVQELANVVDRMMALEPSNILTPMSWRISHGYGFRWKLDGATHLSSLIGEILTSHEKTWEDGAVYEQFMTKMKRMLIDLVLPRVDYNQMTAARILGISRNTLREILRQTS